MRFQNHGFTLLEMVVYVGILVLVVGVVVSLLLWVLRSNANVSAVREVTENSRIAMSVMANEIREADSVYTPTATTTQLSLETRKNLPAGETSTYTDFFLCGTRLCVKRESQNAIAITSEHVEVRSVEFTPVGVGSAFSVQVELGIEFPNPNSRPELTASVTTTDTFSLRSY